MQNHHMHVGILTPYSDVGRLITRVAQRQGHQVTVCTDEPDVSGCFRTSPIPSWNVLFADILLLPRDNATCFLRDDLWRVTDRHASTIPSMLVTMSSQGTIDLMARALRMGSFMHLGYPLRSSVLADCLDRVFMHWHRAWQRMETLRSFAVQSEHVLLLESGTPDPGDAAPCARGATFHTFKVIPQSRSVLDTRQRKWVTLSPDEYAIMTMMVDRPDHCCTTQDIRAAITGGSHTTEHCVRIPMILYRLRQKLLRTFGTEISIERTGKRTWQLCYHPHPTGAEDNRGSHRDDTP